MNPKIFYFSGTGNSLAAARRIAKALSGPDPVPIASVKGAVETAGADRVGVVFPACMWGSPGMVKDFLRCLRTDAYTFLVCTNGGDVAGILVKAARILRSAGTRACAGFSVKMPSNYTPWGIQPAQEREAVLAQAHKRLDEIAAQVAQGRESPVDKGWLLRRVVLTGMLNSMVSGMTKGMDSDFRADPECNGCGTCAHVCPAENIAIEAGRPVWKHRCEQCFSCLHACPKNAIQYGKKTRGVERYRHPEVGLKDLYRLDA